MIIVQLQARAHTCARGQCVKLQCGVERALHVELRGMVGGQPLLRVLE